MGDETGDQDDEILYRPLYTCMPHERKTVTNTKDKRKRDVSDEKEHSVNEKNDVVPSRQRQTEKKRSLKTKSNDRLKTEVVTVDEVSSSEPWEVVALRK